MKKAALTFSKIWLALHIVAIVECLILLLIGNFSIEMIIEIVAEAIEAEGGTPADMDLVTALVTGYWGFIMVYSMIGGVVGLIFDIVTIKKLPGITDKKKGLALAILNILFGCIVTGILMLAMPQRKYEEE